jgi:ABC-type phosphate transport system ATPase subunit
VVPNHPCQPLGLKAAQYTIMSVTHNLQQARIADHMACFNAEADDKSKCIDYLME